MFTSSGVSNKDITFFTRGKENLKCVVDYSDPNLQHLVRGKQTYYAYVAK